MNTPWRSVTNCYLDRNHLHKSIHQLVLQPGVQQTNMQNNASADHMVTIIMIFNENITHRV